MNFQNVFSRIFLSAVLTNALQQPTDATSVDDVPTSCGVSCVRIVCDLYDVPFPKESVEGMLGLGEFGETSLLRIQQCLEDLQFSCSPLKGTYEDVIAASTVPMVAFVKLSPDDAIGHFVVLINDQRRNRLVMLDPFQSKDPIMVDRDAFENHWSGLILAVESHGEATWFGRALWSVLAISLLSALLIRWLRHDSTLTSRTKSMSHALITIILFGVFGSECFARTEGDAKDAAGHVMSLENTKDLGRISSTASENRLAVIFRWNNRTKKPVKIRDTVVSCASCTTLSYDDRTIKAGATVDFLLTVDARGRYGRQSFSAAILFENDEAPAEVFSLHFFREPPPSISPSVVDFGTISEAGTTRNFVFSARLRNEDSGITWLGNVDSSDSSVSCKVLRQRTLSKRLPAETNERLTPLLEFEAAAVGGRSAGPLSGRFLVPVLLNGTRVDVEIPFRGQYVDDISARPSRLIAFRVSGQNIVKMSTTILGDQSGWRPGQEVNTSCDNQDIHTEFFPLGDTNTSDKRVIGRLDVIVDARDNHSLNSAVTISVRSDDGVESIVVPVRVCIIKLPS